VVGDLADEVLGHAPYAHSSQAAAVPVGVREDLARRREHPVGAVFGHVGRRHRGLQPHTEAARAVVRRNRLEARDVLGVGAALYAFSVLIETLVEGRIQDVLGRRRMERTIDEMHDHVIVCGWGRVGKVVADYAKGYGMDQPISENTSEEGRAMNRRVQFKITSFDRPSEEKSE